MRPRNNARDLYSFFGGRSDGVLGLDYGGGNGSTASRLRKAGWLYDSFDPYGHKDVALERVGKYNVVSAFEVFEHSTNPVETLKLILDNCSSGNVIVYVSTGVCDGIVTEETRLQWWYVAPRNGHVTIYSIKSLRVLAEKLGLNYMGEGASRGVHLLTRGVPEKRMHHMLMRAALEKKIRTKIDLWPNGLK